MKPMLIVPLLAVVSAPVPAAATAGQAKLYMRRAGANLKLMEAVQRTAKDAREVLGRPRDAHFATDQAEEWKRTHPKHAGRIDTGQDRSVMRHSFGAGSMLMPCGAQPILD